MHLQISSTQTNSFSIIYDSSKFRLWYPFFPMLAFHFAFCFYRFFLPRSIKLKIFLIYPLLSLYLYIPKPSKLDFFNILNYVFFSDQIINWKQTHNMCLGKFTLSWDLIMPFLYVFCAIVPFLIYTIWIIIIIIIIIIVIIITIEILITLIIVLINMSSSGSQCRILYLKRMCDDG